MSCRFCCRPTLCFYNLFGVSEVNFLPYLKLRHVKAEPKRLGFTFLSKERNQKRLLKYLCRPTLGTVPTVLGLYSIN